MAIGNQVNLRSSLWWPVGLIAFSEVVVWNTISTGYLNGKTELESGRSVRDQINFNEDDTR